MPVYRQKDSHLKEAIRSILNQSYKHFKLVIVLDGASSHVAHVVERLVRGDRRVRVIRYRHNQGVTAALNRGFQSLYRRQHIRYLTWVSSDNVYYPDFIRELRRSLRRNKSKVGLAYSSFVHIDNDGNPVFPGEFREAFKDYQDQRKEALLETCFIGTSFMYKRRYAERIGGYEMEPVEDYDYWLRLTDHCEITYKPLELMNYRVESPYSISRQLASSESQHIRWRYANNLTKFNTRKRRGIKTESTVIVPVTHMDDAVRRRIGELYDQVYSNYHVVVVDGTADGSATRGLQEISDPRVMFVSAPGCDQMTMIRRPFEQGSVSTPFVFIFNAGEDVDGRDLNAMAKRLRSMYDVRGAQMTATGIADVDMGDTSVHLDALYHSGSLQEII